MMLQLNPPIPFVTDKGDKVTAFMVIDYSQEHELLFVCGFDDSRDVWCIPHSQLRMQDNMSLGRFPANLKKAAGPFDVGNDPVKR